MAEASSPGRKQAKVPSAPAFPQLTIADKSLENSYLVSYRFGTEVRTGRIWADSQADARAIWGKTRKSKIVKVEYDPAGVLERRAGYVEVSRGSRFSTMGLICCLLDQSLDPDYWIRTAESYDLGGEKTKPAKYWELGDEEEYGAAARLISSLTAEEKKRAALKYKAAIEKWEADYAEYLSTAPRELKDWTYGRSNVDEEPQAPQMYTSTCFRVQRSGPPIDERDPRYNDLGQAWEPDRQVTLDLVDGKAVVCRGEGRFATSVSQAPRSRTHWKTRVSPENPKVWEELNAEVHCLTWSRPHRIVAIPNPRNHQEILARAREVAYITAREKKESRERLCGKFWHGINKDGGITSFTSYEKISPPEFICIEVYDEANNKTWTTTTQALKPVVKNVKYATVENAWFAWRDGPNPQHLPFGSAQTDRHIADLGHEDGHPGQTLAISGTLRWATESVSCYPDNWIVCKHHHRSWKGASLYCKDCGIEMYDRAWHREWFSPALRPINHDLAPSFKAGDLPLDRTRLDGVCFFETSSVDWVPEDTFYCAHYSKIAPPPEPCIPAVSIPRCEHGVWSHGGAAEFCSICRSVLPLPPARDYKVWRESIIQHVPRFSAVTQAVLRALWSQPGVIQNSAIDYVVEGCAGNACKRESNNKTYHDRLTDEASLHYRGQAKAELTVVEKKRFAYPGSYDWIEGWVAEWLVPFFAMSHEEQLKAAEDGKFKYLWRKVELAVVDELRRRERAAYTPEDVYGRKTRRHKGGDIYDSRYTNSTVQMREQFDPMTEGEADDLECSSDDEDESGFNQNLIRVSLQRGPYYIDFDRLVHQVDEKIERLRTEYISDVTKKYRAFRHLRYRSAYGFEGWRTFGLRRSVACGAGTRSGGECRVIWLATKDYRKRLREINDSNLPNRILLERLSGVAKAKWFLVPKVSDASGCPLEEVEAKPTRRLRPLSRAQRASLLPKKLKPKSKKP